MEVDSSSSVEDLQRRVRQQIEFYFGDSNLLKDRYLPLLIRADPEGYVDLQLVANFNKMKSMTTDLEVIKQAVRNSELVELNEDGTKLKRQKPMPKEDDSTERTAYCENIPQDSTHDSIRAFFEKAGCVEYVALPKKPDKSIKGFAFVEFRTVDDMKKGLEMSQFDAEKNPTGLRVISKEEWMQMKDQYKKLLAQQKHKGFGVGRPPKPPKHQETTFKPGLILHLNKIKEGVDKETIRKMLEASFPVAFVDFTEGSSQAHIRCKKPQEVQYHINLIRYYKDTLGQSLEMRPVTGQEEQVYWVRVEEMKRKVKQQKKQRKAAKIATDGKEPATAEMKDVKPKTHVFFGEDGSTEEGTTDMNVEEKSAETTNQKRKLEEEDDSEVKKQKME